MSSREKILTITLILASIFFNNNQADASWLIDTRKFHISAHGQTSCQDCHEEIGEKALHPDPGTVNKNLADFFNKDQCLSCHDAILDDLDRGRHGTNEVKDAESYSDCLGCHDPHYQSVLDKNQIARFDPEKPINEQCGACHKEQSDLPTFSDEDKSCMVCHRAVDPMQLNDQKKISRLCFHCHGQNGALAQEMKGLNASPINEQEHQSTPHADIACIVCHPQATEYNHGDQQVGDCHQCHYRHDEKAVSDAHMVVSCEACHLGGVQPVRDPESKRVLWTSREHTPGQTSRIHHMSLSPGNISCKRCHVKGNTVGAASMILPAKGLLCMPCHAATFSIGDTTTILSLVIFLAGIVTALLYVLSGSVPGKAGAGTIDKLITLLWNAAKTVFSKKIFLIIKVMILDVLFQRRLYRQSGKRWFIHSLIFLPFAFRFFWGLVALVGSLWTPQWSWIWSMLDKNHPLTAFLFDLTGIMVFSGVALSLIRGGLNRSSRPKGLPSQDRVALILIAGIVVIGFILEGMRISMTGNPGGTAYAFIGYWISTFFLNTLALTGVYGYVWYLHAIVTGAFVAYIPFSRLLHIILAPLILAANEISVHTNKQSTVLL